VKTLARTGSTAGDGASAQRTAARGWRNWRRVGGTLGAVLTTAALIGCGSTASEVNQAVGDAAKTAHLATQLSHKTMRSWCPAAVTDGGRNLTRGQARACLRRAWNGWLTELKRDGYNPYQVAQEK